MPGQTTLSPATPTNQPSGHCEWNGPPRTPPPDGCTDHDRKADAASPVRLRRDGDDHVERARDEVGELELDDRALAHPGRAEGGADESLLGDRRVDDALVAELLEEPLRDAERAAEVADVLAEQEDALVLGEGIVRARRGSPRGT